MTKLSNSDLERLKAEFVEFQRILVSMIEDTAKYSLLVESINNNLDTSRWKNVRCLSGSESKLIESIAVLSNLRIRITLGEHDLLAYLYSHVDCSGFRFFKIEPVIDCNAKIIPQGYNFSANIFLGTIDTIIVPGIFVNNKELETRFAKAIYKEKVNTKDTLVQRKGYFLLENPVTGVEMSIPFEFEYELIK